MHVGAAEHAAVDLDVRAVPSCQRFIVDGERISAITGFVLLQIFAWFDLSRPGLESRARYVGGRLATTALPVSPKLQVVALDFLAVHRDPPPRVYPGSRKTLFPRATAGAAPLSSGLIRAISSSPYSGAGRSIFGRCLHGEFVARPMSRIGSSTPTMGEAPAGRRPKGT